jgi:hypothetical protein
MLALFYKKTPLRNPENEIFNVVNVRFTQEQTRLLIRCLFIFLPLQPIVDVFSQPTSGL